MVSCSRLPKCCYGQQPWWPPCSVWLWTHFLVRTVNSWLFWCTVNILTALVFNVDESLIFQSCAVIWVAGWRNVMMTVKPQTGYTATLRWVTGQHCSIPSSLLFQECYRCHATIEKNGGCNHMVCSTCKAEFCWTCLGPWEPHGSSWYHCNRFNETDAQSARDSQAVSALNNGETMRPMGFRDP